MIKAVVMKSERFLADTPTEEEQQKLNVPKKLIRKQIFPYKNINFTTLKEEVYITCKFSGFIKKNKNFIYGTVQFFIILPSTLEKTDYGSRYDFIGDRLEEVFDDTGIGVFEFRGRGDIDIPRDDFQCHTVEFNITDFHIKG
jgi:hypothetical protein